MYGALGCAAGWVTSGLSCPLTWCCLVHSSTGRKTGCGAPQRGGAAAQGLGFAGPLVICLVTPLFCWSVAGQSWKQCAPRHFLHGDFREKQNRKTSSNIQVVSYLSLFPFSPWGTLEKSTEDHRDPSELRARLRVRVELFSTQIRSAFCEIWAVTEKCISLFREACLGVGGWRKLFLPTWLQERCYWTLLSQKNGTKLWVWLEACCLVSPAGYLCLCYPRPVIKSRLASLHFPSPSA